MRCLQISIFSTQPRSLFCLLLSSRHKLDLLPKYFVFQLRQYIGYIYWRAKETLQKSILSG